MSTEAQIQKPNTENYEKKTTPLFNVIKYDSPIETEVGSDECLLDENSMESNQSEQALNRISAASKVNFSKLSVSEMKARLKNLAKEVKQLKKKLRKAEIKNPGEEVRTPKELQLIEAMLKANKIIQSYEKFQDNSSKNMIENLLDLIQNDKMSLDSVSFRKIMKQIYRCQSRNVTSIPSSTMNNPVNKKKELKFMEETFPQKNHQMYCQEPLAAIPWETQSNHYDQQMKIMNLYQDAPMYSNNMGYPSPSMQNNRFNYRNDQMMLEYYRRNSPSQYPNYPSNFMF